MNDEVFWNLNLLSASSVCPPFFLGLRRKISSKWLEVLMELICPLSLWNDVWRKDGEETDSSGSWRC